MRVKSSQMAARVFLVAAALALLAGSAPAAPGDPDKTFGSDGVVTTLHGQWSSGDGLAIQPDGKILVAGASSDGLMVARYMPDGALDPSFGSAGLVTSSAA